MYKIPLSKKSIGTLRALTLSLIGIAALTGCAASRTPIEPMTQLQVREMQSREFDTNNTKLVMKSMMDVLQDEGYVIKNAVLELGLLSAEKQIDIENRSEAILAAMSGPHVRWKKQKVFEATGNVSEFGNKTRVRMNFLEKKLDNLACPMEIISVSDPLFYQNFFEKVSKGIFIQEQGI